MAVSLSLMLTMVVSGLWHGTTVGFLLFGLVHGMFFVVYHAWDTLLLRRFGRAAVHRFRARPVIRAGGMVLTFNATALAFVFFQVRTERITEVLRAWLG
jgi:D-alanyl-lipoteichoic acid acyltransferase DltB (MBOAT superfamily)